MLQQIGRLVALGLFFSLISILIALPAWLNRLEKRNPLGRQKKFPLLGTGVLARTVHAHPRLLVIFSILLVLSSLPGLKNIQFERSLEALHPEGMEVLAVRQSIFAHFRRGITGVFVSFTADTPPEFRRKCKRSPAPHLRPFGPSRITQVCFEVPNERI